MKRPHVTDPTVPGPLPTRGWRKPWKMLLLGLCAAGLMFYAAPVLSQIAGVPRPPPEQTSSARKDGDRKAGARIKDADKFSGHSPATLVYSTDAHPGAPPLSAPVGLTGFMIRGALALAMLPLMLWMARYPRTVNRIGQPGFEVISPSEKRRFIPLEDRFQAMDFVTKIQTRGGLRLSANLNKVTLSIRRFGYLMEDKNYRNALLVNRRRVRRTLLRDGDVLDLGDLTLLYRDHREPKVIRHASVTPGDGKSQIKFARPKGPVRRTVNRIGQPGFEVISPSEKRRFIPLEDRFQAMDFVTKIQTRGGLRLSANLNKVTLSIRRFGYLMEDKNYRNALLVNRRRVRRTLLRDGDVLDLGDLTLLYRDHREPKVIRHASVTPGDGKSQIKFARPKGPVRKGVGMLTSEQVSNRPFFLTKNVIYIGRSESNDLTIKSRAVYYRHAKIEKVGGRYKMKDLSILGNTFINNRRIEQRFLKDGDEISIEMHRFKFQIVSRTTGERPSTPRGAAAESEPDASRKAYGKEQEGEIEEQESALPS